MHKILPFLGVLFFLASHSQTKTIIYCFPGQGSDKRIFDSLVIKQNYQLKVIEYGTPDKGISMNVFARQLAQQIDTNSKFVLMGVSLGGMLCAEINEFLRPEKTIIISSAKNKNELPFRYRFQKAIPLYKLFPGRVILAGAKILQPIVEPDRNKNKSTFKSMLSNKKPRYMKQTVGLIIKWDRKINTRDIYHIHGNKDHTLPIRKIKSPTYILENGSHMMALTRAKDVSEVINIILEK